MAFYGASVEYALHTMVVLSEVPDGVNASARDLAEFQKLPLAFIQKTLTQLSAAGLISGMEGVKGGWALALPPNQITLLAVAEAVQPCNSLFNCREIRRHCALWHNDTPPKSAITGICSIHVAMLSAEAAMKKELKSQTIEAISNQVAAKTEITADGSREWFVKRFQQRSGKRQEEGKR